MSDDGMVWDRPVDPSISTEYETVADYMAEVWLPSPEERIARWEGVKWFPGEPGDYLLDVGCGNGTYRRLFTEVMGFEYEGCDFSERMLELAREANPGVEFTHGRLPVDGDDDARLPYEDNTFEVVFCTNVLEHLFETRPAVEELLRVASDWVVVHQRAMVEGPPTNYREKRGPHGQIVRIECSEDVYAEMHATGGLYAAHTMEEFEVENGELGRRVVGEVYFVLDARGTSAEANEGGN